MAKVKALILSGYGINCEKEMAAACELAGATSQIIHMKSLLLGAVQLDGFDLLIFPGGFSFGDDLGAGKAFANRLKFSHFQEQIENFVARGKCILGVCNGFQILVKLGLFKQEVTLTNNSHFRFDNRWVQHNVCASPCVFTQGLENVFLPIRHAEGRFVVKDEQVLKNLIEQKQIVLQYADPNPNGSVANIAGICDPTGRVFGMMAHPEAATSFHHLPNWTRLKKESPFGPGMQLFKNAIHYLENA